MEEVEDEILESDKINTRVMETLQVIKKATSLKPSEENISTVNGTSSDKITPPVSLPTSTSKNQTYAKPMLILFYFFVRLCFNYVLLNTAYVFTMQPAITHSSGYAKHILKLCKNYFNIT